MLGNGSRYGISLSYKVKPSLDGLAQTFILGGCVGDDECAMILGDNIFHDGGLKRHIQETGKNRGRATVFVCYVEESARFGIVEFNREGRVVLLEEKPA